MKTSALFLPLGLLPIAILAQEKTAEPPPARGALADVPRSLAEMLEAALRSNPEILQAEAKVRQAQANLNQARLKVMEEVVSAFHEREKQEAVIRGVEQTLERTKTRVKTGTETQLELGAAEQAYAEARAKFLQNEARARYILGLGGLVGETAGLGANTTLQGAAPVERPRRERPPIPEKYLKLLEKKVSQPVNLFSVSEIGACLREELQTQVISTLGEVGNRSFPFEGSLRSVLTAAADLSGVVVVFRDYGVLLTTRELAATMNAPTFPEDIPLKE
jgi:hypothetical protein